MDEVFSVTNLENVYSDNLKVQMLSEFQRRNFYAFTLGAYLALNPSSAVMTNWHLEAMCLDLDLVAQGKQRKLMINVPPRHFKSFCSSVSLVAFMLGHDPRLEIMVATYNTDLNTDFSNQLRQLIKTPFFKRLFPNLKITKNTEDVLKTSRGGGRYSVTPERPNTGIGADIIIVDDIMNNADVFSSKKRENAHRFFQTALYSRQNDKKSGRIVIAQQRQHEDDFASKMMDLDNIRILTLKSIADTNETFPLYFNRTHTRQPGDILFPELEPRETLEEIRRDIGPFAFEAQCQQNPQSAEGQVFRMGKLNYYDKPLERDECGCVVQSWDTASALEAHNDYSVCTTWGFKDPNWHLLNVTRERLAYPDLKARLLAMQEEWDADYVVVEAADSGRQLVAELHRKHNWLRALKPRDSKLQRAHNQVGNIEEPTILFPSFATPWREAFFNELSVFPNGSHDDQVDSVVQLLMFISDRRAPDPRRPRSDRSKPVREPGSKWTRDAKRGVNHYDEPKSAWRKRR